MKVLLNMIKLQQQKHTGERLQEHNEQRYIQEDEIDLRELQSNDLKTLYLDNPHNLAIILENSQNIKASMSQDKGQISTNLNKTYKFILQGEEQKA